MSGSRIVARWLMRLTTRRPPPGRAEWALAMQREFDMLENGELAWALGCASVMATWKLRRNWPYLALLCLVPFYIIGVPMFEFDLLGHGVISRSFYVNFMRDYGAVWAMLTPLPLAIILGAYRPNNIVTTILFGLLVQHIGKTLCSTLVLSVPFLSWWGSHATLYMAPPLVGLCASLGVWCVGVNAGARLARSGPGGGRLLTDSPSP